MQSPDISRMLGAALHLGAQAEIVAIDLLGLFKMALIQKQRSQSVTRGVHPGPRFRVTQIVVQLDRPAQMPVGLLVPTLVVGQFTVQQSRADRQ